MILLNLDQLIYNIEVGKLSEVLQTGVELKSEWDQGHGKDISAIANQVSFLGGWLMGRRIS